MRLWICEQCGAEFARDKSGTRPIRFCTQACYHAWAKARPNAGQFKGGLSPWNKGLKGLRLSPETEWKKGRKSENWMPVGSETERRDKNGRMRAFVKVSEPNVWRERALVVWEAMNGPLPKGCVVHHKDRNSLNDAPTNLEAMTRAEHLKEHRDEIRAPRPKQEAVAP